MAVTLLGAAEALPSAVLTSEEVEDRIREASGVRLPRGILRRPTGIDRRHVAADDEYASTLAARAGVRALERAAVDAADVDLLVFAAASRDFVEPATAHVVAHELGITGQVFDVTNACNSAINGIEVARSLLLAGGYERALVVVGETPTRSIRWELGDLGAFATHFAGYTFGDAGAAVVLARGAGPGLGAAMAESHPEHWAVGGIFGGGSRRPFEQEAMHFTGAGVELRAAFEAAGPGLVDRALRREGWRMADVRRVFVHQVTVPYRERFCAMTGVTRGQLVETVEELGNVAAASLPIQLARCWDELRPGDRCLFVGLGGGISIAACPWSV